MSQYPTLQLEPTAFPFTDHERARLLVYRAAVAAHLYGEFDADSSNGARPFTAPDLNRFAAYRAAIEAGLYSDFFQSGGHAERQPNQGEIPPLHWTPATTKNLRNEGFQS
jgi:hypothetical protein